MIIKPKPSTEWLHAHCHELNNHDLVIVAKAFIDNGHIGKYTIEDFFSSEYENQCSEFFLREQICKSINELQETVDNLNFKKNFSVFAICIANYESEKENILRDIKKLHDEADSLVFSEKDPGSKEFQEIVQGIRQSVRNFNKRLKELDEEISFARNLFKVSSNRFKRTPRLRIFQIFENGEVWVDLAPIEWTPED